MAENKLCSVIGESYWELSKPRKECIQCPLHAAYNSIKLRYSIFEMQATTCVLKRDRGKTRTSSFFFLYPPSFLQTHGIVGGQPSPPCLLYMMGSHSALLRLGAGCLCHGGLRTQSDHWQQWGSIRSPVDTCFPSSHPRVQRAEVLWLGYGTVFANNPGVNT